MYKGEPSGSRPWKLFCSFCAVEENKVMVFACLIWLVRGLVVCWVCEVNISRLLQQQQQQPPVEFCLLFSLFEELVIVCGRVVY